MHFRCKTSFYSPMPDIKLRAKSTIFSNKRRAPAIVEMYAVSKGKKQHAMIHNIVILIKQVLRQAKLLMSEHVRKAMPKLDIIY